MFGVRPVILAETSKGLSPDPGPSLQATMCDLPLCPYSKPHSLTVS